MCIQINAITNENGNTFTIYNKLNTKIKNIKNKMIS